MKEEKLIIAYGTGSKSISLNKGEQHMVLSASDLAFIVESAIRNGQVEIKVSSYEKS